jgi:SAM-dependent methyltransferase
MRNPACMNDPIRQLYQTRIYPAMSHPPADPAVSGVAALLGGLDVRVPSKARVIEIGCASGHNLIPLAMRWPESRFVGIDLSEAAIQQARDLAEAAGAGNVAFQTADLRDFEDGGEPYDFIIAHGFFSWVPDEVKSALLEFCRRKLASGGIATISFNLESGWLPRLPVIQKTRAILQAGAADEMAALAILRTVTDPDSADTEIIDDMIAKGPDILPFDDFAPINDPWSLERFVTTASATGLRWLGASDPGRAATAKWQTFHSAVLCRDDAPLRPRVSWAVLEGLSVRAGDRPVPADPVRAALGLVSPDCIPVWELELMLPGMERRELGQRLIEGFRSGSILPRMEAVRFDPQPPERPALDAFRLECARRKLPVVDIWHRPCSFPSRHFEVLARMDGTLDQASLEAFAERHCPELNFKPWLRHLAGRGIFA